MHDFGSGFPQLLDRFDAAGMAIDTIVASGGAAASDLVCQMLADSTGRRVALPLGEEPVLRGAAMLGGVGAGVFDGFAPAMAAMSGAARVFVPAGGKVARLHDQRFAAFTALQAAARALREARRAD